MTTSVFTYNLAGSVRHQGLSISGATVSLYEPSGNRTADSVVAVQLTGNKGEFAFAVPPGIYKLEVVPDHNTRFLRKSVAEVVVNSNTTCDIGLLIGSVLTVKALTSGGAPTTAGELVALGIEPSSYRGSAGCNENGHYSLVLPRGKYHIGFRFPQPIPGASNSDHTQGFISRSIKVLELDGDDTFEVKLPAFVNFEGQVTDLFGVPATNVKVRLSPSKAQENLVLSELGLDATCVTDQTGSFQIMAESGAYDISIEPDQSGLLFAATESGVEIAANMSKKFQLAEGCRLRGQVQYELTPLPQCLVRIQGMDHKIDTLAKTDDNGQFSVGLPAGNYKLVVSAHAKHGPDLTIEGAEFSGLAPWTRMIVVGANTNVAVRLHQGTSLSGKILADDGRVRPGLKVSVFADEDRVPDEVEFSVPLASCMSDAEGNYSFFLASGSYWLAVHTDLANARKIEIDSDPVKFDIDWHGWCILKFELVGDSDQKIPRCRVGYSPYSSSATTDDEAKTSLPRGYVLTDQDGLCQLTLPAGIYTLSFTPPPASSYEAKSIKQLSISTDIVRTIKLLKSGLSESELPAER